MFDEFYKNTNMFFERGAIKDRGGTRLSCSRIN